MLGQASAHLTSSPLRTFKRALLDELLYYRSTSPSPIEPLCLFPNLGRLSEKNDHKRSFDTGFINSRPLARNHTTKEMDLSFGECGWPVGVEPNRLCQLELLDRKTVYIIETIFLAAALFWDLVFIPCPYHTMILASKLGLRMQSIASGFVKERIESVWANRTICQLDQLFQNNLESGTQTAIIYTQPSAKAGGKFF